MDRNMLVLLVIKIGFEDMMLNLLFRGFIKNILGWK